jgi:hypothetical protein
VLSAVLHQCEGCTVERKSYLLRVLVNAMGNSKAHTGLVLMFHPDDTAHVDVVVSAFPLAPWMYVFDHPYATAVPDRLSNERCVVAS